MVLTTGADSYIKTLCAIVRLYICAHMILKYGKQYGDKSAHFSVYYTHSFKKLQKIKIPESGIIWEKHFLSNENGCILQKQWNDMIDDGENDEFKD